MQELTEELLAGTRALEGVEGLEWSGELSWLEELDAWGLTCRLSVEVPCQRFVPAITPWWIRINSTYPAGRLDFLPAKEGGIVQTFPHQRYNGDGNPEEPWRSGNLCLHTDITSLKRYGYDVEPMDAKERLRWNVERARQWLECAARGELLTCGDRFELPDFPTDGDGWLAFCETAQSLAAWQSTDVDYGYVRTRVFEEPGKLKLVTAFEDENSRPVIPAPHWGNFVREKTKDGPEGLWLRVPEIPVLEPWQAPATWTELAGVLEQQGIKVGDFLPRLLERRFRNSGKKPRARPRHPLLLGFPIPEIMGEVPVRMHWVGFDLPRLAEGKETVNGFRPNAKGHFQRDLASLRRLERLPWLRSQNWSDEDLTGRGRLPARLREANTLLVGAGALGSAMAELLVRGGVRSLLLFDGEALEAGNLVRHTLVMGDLGCHKAEALARRLNQVSPHAEVTAVSASFPRVPKDLKAVVEEADLVLDCSADDGVLFHLERYPWRKARVFVSVSLGLRACRLYCFVAQAERFPRSTYVKAVTPWVERDWSEVDEDQLPREGHGCWNPLMPAGADDVWLLTAAAVKFLGQLVEDNAMDRNGRLTAFEQIEEEGEFRGVRQVPESEAR